MLNPNEQALINFVQRESKRLPVVERIAIYRGLSELDLKFNNGGAK
ncbi:MAG: hypothetical protein KGL39_46380 [Patescibacteria group bacterium]|nr:hypothetical protein [Patescibacteria group bacterium]